MEVEELPYKAEYAKSGRAKCRSCKTPIGAGALRLAAMVQSPMFDGRVPNWYHEKCFFLKQRPKATDDIADFATLRYADQKKIKENISSCSSIILPAKKGKKRAGADISNTGLKDFTLEYSKSSRAVCRGCEIKIMKDEIRISKKDFETDVGKKYGGQDMWHHLTCFAKLRVELGYFANGDQLPGFSNLKKDDQQEVKKQLAGIKQEDIPDVKKLKGEEVDSTDPVEIEYKDQNKQMYKHRDALKKNLSKKELILLLEHNCQEIPSGEDRILDRLADCMTFGSLMPCPKCKEGQYVYNTGGYVCGGDLTEWTKCNDVTKTPKRTAFTVPKELKEYPFLNRYKYKELVRIIRDVKSRNGVKKEEDERTGPKVEREKPALYNMEFVILGDPRAGKEKLKKDIVSMGGKVTTKISNTIMAIISTVHDVEKLGARMLNAKDLDIHVVSDEFVREAKKYVGKIPELVIKKNICGWGSDPNKRLPAEMSAAEYKSSKSRSIFTSKSSKVTLTLKGGTAVDPDSGLDNKAHVYQSDSDKYTVVLGLTDIQQKKNSYYKIQLLQSDKGGKFWIFRSWGRIGTTIGSNKLEPMTSLHEAKRSFENLYEEKTGNCWDMRDDFMKIPGKMYPIDVDYGEDESKTMKIDTDIESKLATPIQKLMHMIFNLDSMKKLMLEFELDTEKMPLGKLSKSQMKKAYSVLAELQALTEKKDVSKAKLIDASNRFYTYIPHSFGIENPPIIDNPELIKQKIEMIENLMEIEIAYSLMKTTSSSAGVDGHYAQLKTEIGVLERECDEFKIIEEYVRNTHAATHSNYDLVISEVFSIKRSGEEKRFKPFKKLPNRKLLWHGSRTTNFAGILSQGLRIAPPEAPVTGYMFGKGIYFADMVSKSANYCCTGPGNPTGLLMLCDVALGSMYERTNAEYVEKLPKGMHSCKGVGRTEPDPSYVKKIHGDIEVPLGKPTENTKVQSSLLYNEFIVYDVAQVNAKYLLQLDFKYKY